MILYFIIIFFIIIFNFFLAGALDKLRTEHRILSNGIYSTFTCVDNKWFLYVSSVRGMNIYYVIRDDDFLPCTITPTDDDELIFMFLILI